MSWVWQVWCWQYHCLYIHDNHSSLPCPIMSWVWQVCCWHCQCHCLYLHDNHTSLPCPGTCDGSSRAGADKLLGPLLQGLSHVQLVFVHDVVQRQEVLLQSVDQRDGELVVHHLLFCHHNQPAKKTRGLSDPHERRMAKRGKKQQQPTQPMNVSDRPCKKRDGHIFNQAFWDRDSKEKVQSLSFGLLYISGVCTGPKRNHGLLSFSLIHISGVFTGVFTGVCTGPKWSYGLLNFGLTHDSGVFTDVCMDVHTGPKWSYGLLSFDLIHI